MNKKLHNNLDDKIMKHSWKKIALGEILLKKKESVNIQPDKEYKQVTVRINHKGVTQRKIVQGINIGSSQYLVNKGDFIISKIDARNGAMGLIPPELAGSIVTNDFPLFRFSQKILPKYFNYYSGTSAFDDACKNASEGSTNRRRLKMDKFSQIEIPLPPLEEQQQIVSKLEKVHERSVEIRKLRAEQEQDIKNLLYSEYFKIIKDVRWKKMQNVAPITRRLVDIKPNGEYPELGIRSFGNGTFHKPVISGVEVGQKKLFRIKSGDLMFSNVFAWEGAIAVAKEEDNNRVGSHRFISCVPDLEQISHHFICYHFLSPKGMEDINYASPGGAGRNRTLGLKKLENIEVPIPPIEKQQEFEALQKQLNQLRDHYNETNQNLDDLFPALLDKAFKGELVSMESLLINAS